MVTIISCHSTPSNSHQKINSDFPKIHPLNVLEFSGGKVKSTFERFGMSYLDRPRSGQKKQFPSYEYERGSSKHGSANPGISLNTTSPLGFFFFQGLTEQEAPVDSGSRAKSCWSEPTASGSKSILKHGFVTYARARSRRNRTRR